jgi:hypothetical protein
MQKSEPSGVTDAAGPEGPQRGPPANETTKSSATRTVLSRRRKPVPVRIARVVAGGLVVALCAVLVSWWAIGGRWFIVRTPSMGTYAPVGALLWVKPVNINNVHVGDVITFRTPPIGAGSSARTTAALKYPSQIYTHRVVARDPDGTLQTKGDLNLGTDPWRIDQQHLIGQVMAAWPGVGWLVGALPLLIPGAIAWWVLTGVLASKRSRAPLRVLGAAALVAAALYVYNPLFGAEQLSFVPLGPAGARATYVGTGLMPVRLVAEGVNSVLVHAGEARSIVAAHLGQGGHYQVKVQPTVPWQTWVVVAALGFAPAVWSAIVGVAPPPPEGGEARHRRRRFRRRESVEAPQ